MFSHGKSPFIYCNARGRNSLWAKSRTVCTKRRCSSDRVTNTAIPSLLLSTYPTGELDIAECIDPRIEETADDGRGFVFDDDGRAGDEGPGQEVAALVDRHLNELAGFGVEDRARACGLRRVRLGSRLRRGRLRWDRGRKQQYPAQDLDLHPRDDAAVKTTVLVLERGAEQCRVIVMIISGRQRHRNFVALAAIAHKGRARLGQRCLAGAAADDRLRPRGHSGGERIGCGGVELVEALQ